MAKRRQFTLILYTARQVSDRATARALWRLLDDPLIAPHRFDSVERAKRPFRAGAAAEAAQLYDDERSLFVRGERDKFVAMFSAHGRGPARWYFWVDLKAMKGEKGERWLDWFLRLCGELPPLFGSGCSEEEYEAKHYVVTEHAGGGSSTGAVGISTAEFWKYLPGIYWLTVFGPELVETFGAAKLRALPGTEARDLEGGQVALRLTEPVEPADMEQRLGREAQLADALGAQYFFDRRRPEAEFKPVAALLEAMQRSRD